MWRIEHDMITAMRNVLTLIAVLVLLSCSTGAQQATTTARDTDVAARVGDRAITVKELDDRWRETDPAQLAQATQALYDGRRAALDDLIASMLIEQAAKAKGVAPQQYVDAEVARRVKPVSDAEIAVFYGENRGQMQGRSLEEMSPLIRRYLDDRQKQSARAELVGELRKAGPSVSVMIEAPRQTIALAPDDPSQGPANAPVTLVEFSDFQCPFCQRVVPTLKQIKAKYGDRVRIVWKDYPLTQIHPQAFDAAQAGNCAREQGKFWEYHDQLFSNQAALQPEFLKKYATDAGMDAAAFSACFDSRKFEPKVQQALAAGARVGVSSTPTTFVNGRMVSGAQPLEAFTSVIDEELARASRK
jgi:protein-disulfide isomerase